MHRKSSVSHITRPQKEGLFARTQTQTALASQHIDFSSTLPRTSATNGGSIDSNVADGGQTDAAAVEETKCLWGETFKNGSCVAEKVESTYLKNNFSYRRFGNSVALSKDGTTLVVGAEGEDGASLDPTDNSSPNTGAAYLYEWPKTAVAQ